QDDLRLRPNLMINLGLRYSVDTPRHEASGAQSVLDLTTPNNGNSVLQISPAVPGALIYGRDATGAKTYFRNFGPRIGFSYAPQKLLGRIPNMVVRGGYSIYYAPLQYSDLLLGDLLSSGTTASPSFQSPDNFTVAQSPAGNVLVDQPFPQFTPPSNARDPALRSGQTAAYVAPEFGKPGMVQNWSLEVQHELAKDLILNVGYVGMHSTRLHSL